MLSQFFVIFVGTDIEDNPLNKGVTCFLSEHGAKGFIEAQTNKGYVCHLFRGEFIKTYFSNLLM